ncbi:hypothetical protein CBR_g32314 [Chara braunii]|uniref:CCHC-type domain-containing protein n=1 Tax=Chara braunii TaxID=69332 RepID=A0A388JNE6_CHABU|nr:hypothetical protein CBR_g32314 [Chara braunii]|eukprot:GBG59301.1 hypothetical protein CBR_g32314 [Chara braunii]
MVEGTRVIVSIPDPFPFFPNHAHPEAWLEAVEAQNYSAADLPRVLTLLLRNTSHEWFRKHAWVDWDTFKQAFLARFDTVSEDAAWYVLKNRPQGPGELLPDFVDRFQTTLDKSGRDEKSAQDLFIDHLRSPTLKGKLQKKVPPKTHQLSAIITKALELELADTKKYISQGDEDITDTIRDVTANRRSWLQAVERFYPCPNHDLPGGIVSDTPPASSSSPPVNQPIAVVKSGISPEPSSPAITNLHLAQMIHTATTKQSEWMSNLIQMQAAHMEQIMSRLIKPSPTSARPAPTSFPLLPAPPAPRFAPQFPHLANPARKIECFNCKQPGHFAWDCPQPKHNQPPPAAAPVALNQGRVAALMDTDQGGEFVAYAPKQPSPSMATASTSGASSSDAADVVDPLEYLHLAGMIGAIRLAPDDLEWVDRESNPGPQFPTRDIDVLKTLKQLDIRVPIPVGHLLTISEAANDKLLQHCQKNQKRFTYQRIQRMLKKKEGSEEVAPPESDTREPEPEAARIAAISLAEKDHFIRARPVLWKSAEYDCEVWGKPFNTLIDTGSFAVAISLDTVKMTGRLGSILPQSGKNNYVSADEEAMNIVGIIENVAVKVGRVHVLVNALVIDVRSYSALLGLPWTMVVGARLHFDSKQLVLTQTGGKPQTVPLRVSTRMIKRVPNSAQIGMIRCIDPEERSPSHISDGIREQEYEEELSSEDEWKHLVELFEHEIPEEFQVCPDPARSFHVDSEDSALAPPITQSMDFDIRHRKQERHGNADGLTRLHRPEKVPKSEEVLDAQLLQPRGHISEIRQVCHPRLNADLRRLMRFFCDEGICAAAAFRIEGSPHAVVFAEVTAVHRRADPKMSHVTTVAAFSGDISSVNPQWHTAILTSLREWTEQVSNVWQHVLARQGYNLILIFTPDLDNIRRSPRER